MKKIVIGSDHRGFEFKEYILAFPDISKKLQIELIDVGAFTSERSDYPQFAHQAMKKMHEENIHGSILLCGSGNGMAIAANRFKGIFACVAWNAVVARASKEDDNCNVLVIPADYVAKEEMITIISSWLSANFKGGRYAERLAQIDQF